MSTADPKNASNEFIETINNHLSDGQFEQLIGVISDEKNFELVKDTSWDVIPIITQHLNEKEANSCELLKCCKICLLEIARKGNPEETLLELLAEAEDLTNDVKFLAVLEPIAIVLLRLKRRRGQSMEWCFKMVQEHLKVFPQDNLCCDEGDETEVKKSKTVLRIKDLYVGVVPFYKPLVQDVCQSHSSLDPDLEVQRKALICSLLKLLGKPFVHLEESAIESLKEAAEELVGFVCNLLVDPLILMDFTEEDDNLFLMSRECGPHIAGLDSSLMSNRVTVQSLGVFYYLIFSKEMHLESIPWVYHPTFIFHHGLHLACYFLESSENSVLVKGLCLSESVLARLSNIVLASDVLALPVHYEFTKFLVHIMVYCPVKSSRILAINLFKEYLSKFDHKGQYLLLFNIHSSVDHSCSNLRGFLMTQIKEIIHRTLNEDIKSVYFSGKCLCDLVSMYCNVPQGPDTYLLEVSDEVMSALNLIRFLILRDKSNKTGIWTYLRTLKDGFFTNLAECLKFSRENFNKLEMEMKMQDADSKFSVTVGNEDLSMRSDDEERLQAKNVFDLMEDVLERVKECLAETEAAKEQD